VTRCGFCDAGSHFRDRHSGEYVCPEHARLEVVAGGTPRSESTLTIRQAESSDYPRIGQLSRYFWDETTVDCFGRRYDLLSCPAFLACDGGKVVGLASYAVEADSGALALVDLSLLPDYQGRGGGWALLDAVRTEAKRRKLGRLIVATCNDNLPALALYQRYGFRLTEVFPGRVARHHGGELAGFAGIPVRDEIRLAYEVKD
jgi:ribosomal protein S18 acetylase RimI-like enzyme